MMALFSRSSISPDNRDQIFYIVFNSITSIENQTDRLSFWYGPRDLFDPGTMKFRLATLSFGIVLFCENPDFMVMQETELSSLMSQANGRHIFGEAKLF